MLPAFAGERNKMDAAATSAKLKRDCPRISPNYVSLRDLQELRRKEKEQQQQQQQERLQRQREVEPAVAVGGVEEGERAPKTEEGRGSSEKSWGGGERNRRGKRWAAVAHRDAPAAARTEVAAKKVDRAIGVMAVTDPVAPAPAPLPQGVAKKMDGAIGVLAVAQPEAPPPPPRGEDAAKKKGGAIGGSAVKKTGDEPAASAFQAGAKPDNKGKGKVAAGTKHPITPAETATVSSPSGTPEEKRKGKPKAPGDQVTAPVTSAAAREPAEAASVSSRGRGKPANYRNLRKGGVGRSSVTAAPGETADASAPCVVEPQDKGKKKPSGDRRAGAAPTSDSSGRKSSQPAPTSDSSGGKRAHPAPIGNSPDGRSAQLSPEAELSRNRRSGGVLGETKPEGAVVEAEATARAVRVVVRSARPPSIGGPRQQHAGGRHGGVWVPKAVAPAPSRHSGSVRTPDSS